MFIETLINYINLMDANNVFVNIAQYIILHTKDVVHMKLEEMADACFVSSATISRFCRFFGLDNFTDLRLTCQKEINTAMWRGNIVLQPAQDYSNLYEQFNGYASLVSDTLKRIAFEMDIREVQWLVEKIAYTKEVAFIDASYALPFAQDLQRIMAISNKFVYCYTKIEQQIECIKTLNTDSLIVAFFVDLGFNTMNPKVLDALSSGKGQKILVTVHEIDSPDIFDKVICIDKNGHEASTYCMTFFVNILVSAWYQNVVTSRALLDC